MKTVNLTKREMQFIYESLPPLWKVKEGEQFQILKSVKEKLQEAVNNEV